MLNRNEVRGGNKSGLRAYNERMVINLVRRGGSLSKAQITRETGLSAQTISVIVKRLLERQILQEGEKVRGQIGQPSTPVSLHPHGAYSIGLKIGRRSLEIALVDFLGTTLRQSRFAYAYPDRDEVMREIEKGLDYVTTSLSRDQRARIVGVGIAAPREMESWSEELAAPKAALAQWRDFDLRAAVADLAAVDVYLYNDATAACAAEMHYGDALEYRSALYVYVGTFVGGGVVLDGRLYQGETGNAGAIGPMPVPSGAAGGAPLQLLRLASLAFLERALDEAGLDAIGQIEDGYPDSAGRRVFDDWRDQAAYAIAFAIVAAASVIDFQGVVVDGAVPAVQIGDLVDNIRRHMADFNLRGLSAPEVRPGGVGPAARVLGGAMLPIYENFSPDRSLLVKTGQAGDGAADA